MLPVSAFILYLTSIHPILSPFVHPSTRPTHLIARGCGCGCGCGCGGGRIVTGRLQHYGDVCVRFAYHMYGIDIGELHMYTLTDGTRMDLWSRYGDQKINDWTLVMIHIEYVSLNTKVSARLTLMASFSLPKCYRLTLTRVLCRVFKSFFVFPFPFSFFFLFL
jgi:hypothetical protein